MKSNPEYPYGSLASENPRNGNTYVVMRRI